MLKLINKSNVKFLAIAAISCGAGFHLFLEDQIVEGVTLFSFGFVILEFVVLPLRVDLQSMKDACDHKMRSSIQWLQCLLPALAGLTWVCLDICHTGHVQYDLVHVFVLFLVVFFGWASSHIYAAVVTFFDLILNCRMMFGVRYIRYLGFVYSRLPSFPAALFSPPRFRLAHREA